MKNSETLFKFPVLLYDGISLERRTKKEIEEDIHSSEGIQPYVRGYVKIPYDEIVGYMDTWRIGRKVEEVKVDGFCSTLVYTKTLGDFICPLKLEKFEKLYDEFADKMVDLLEEEINNSIQLKKDSGTSDNGSVDKT